MRNSSRPKKDRTWILYKDFDRGLNVISVWKPMSLLNMALLSIPGKPVACNHGLLSVNYGLLWGIVASYFGLLGVPGIVAYINPKDPPMHSSSRAGSYTF